MLGTLEYSVWINSDAAHGRGMSVVNPPFSGSPRVIGRLWVIGRLREVRVKGFFDRLRAVFTWLRAVA